MNRTPAHLLLTFAAISVTAFAGVFALAAPADAAVTDPPPINEIGGSATNLTSTIWGMAVGADGSTYVDSHSANSIVGFPAGATGNVAPAIDIQGSNTGLNKPNGLALDAHGNLWVVNGGTTDGGSVEEFAPGATGNATPIRTIAGLSTGFDYPTSIAFGADGTLYVVNYFATDIEIFPADANGDVAPSRTIGGSNTNFINTYPWGIGLEPDGSIVVSGYYNTIQTFAANASGNAFPLRTISGANTGLNLSYYLAIDPLGNIYVANYEGESITEFPETADGNVAPESEMTGATSELSGPFPLAFDSAHNLYVGNVNSSTVTEYAADLTVTGVSPAVDGSSGGETVTIHGYGFSPGATVTFGGTAATDVTVVSSTTITAVVPAHVGGKVDVAVTQNDTTATAAGAFTYTSTALATTGVDSGPTLAAGILLALVGGVLLIARRIRRAHAA